MLTGSYLFLLDLSFLFLGWWIKVVKIEFMYIFLMPFLFCLIYHLMNKEDQKSSTLVHFYLFRRDGGNSPKAFLQFVKKLRQSERACSLVDIALLLDL